MIVCRNFSGSEKAREFLCCFLQNDSFLGRLYMNTFGMDNGDVYAIVPASVDAESISFTEGGCGMVREATLLLSSFLLMDSVLNNKEVLIELTLSKKTDPYIAKQSHTLFFCGEVPFYRIRRGFEQLNEIQTMVCDGHSAYSFIAYVLSEDARLLLDKETLMENEGLERYVEKIVVGACDNEAYLIFAPRRS